MYPTHTPTHTYTFIVCAALVLLQCAFRPEDNNELIAILFYKHVFPLSLYTPISQQCLIIL